MRYSGKILYTAIEAFCNIIAALLLWRMTATHPGHALDRGNQRVDLEPLTKTCSSRRMAYEAMKDRLVRGAFEPGHKLTVRAVAGLKRLIAVCRALGTPPPISGCRKT